MLTNTHQYSLFFLSIPWTFETFFPFLYIYYVVDRQSRFKVRKFSKVFTLGISTACIFHLKSFIWKAAGQGKVYLHGLIWLWCGGNTGASKLTEKSKQLFKSWENISNCFTKIPETSKPILGFTSTSNNQWNTRKSRRWKLSIIVNKWGMRAPTEGHIMCIRCIHKGRKK